MTTPDNHVSESWPPGLLAQVEDAGLNATAPPQQRWLDGWLMRTWPGQARRSRCVNALGPGQLALAERLETAERLCQEQGVPLLFRATPFTHPASLPQDLQAWGFRPIDASWVMVTGPLSTLPSIDPAPDERRTTPEPAAIERLDADAFAEVVGEWRGTAPADRPRLAERLRQAPVAHHAFVISSTPPARPVACGQVALDGPLAGLYDIVVDRKARGHGWGRRLCQHLLEHAAAQGAVRAYLQVDAANTAARALYRSLGFSDAYPYHYLEREAP